MASDYEEKYTEQEWICVLQDRLAAYEDTGLTPEEVSALITGVHGAIPELIAAVPRVIAAIADTIRNYDWGGIDRLRELAEAAKGGRLVVLPCKVGDTVWAILDGAKYARECKVDFVNIGSVGTTFVLAAKNWLREQYGVTAAAFGKSIFFTREEAEKALEAKKDE